MNSVEEKKSTDNFIAVPAEMRKRDQWMTWYYAQDGGKRPNGKSNTPDTWTTFTSIAEGDKIAFVIDGDDPFTGVDLDGCIVDGEWTDWSVPIIEKFRGVAYCEVSPSGTGVKLTTKAAKPEGSRCKEPAGDGEGKQWIECYDHGRFWTVTGNVVEGFETIGDGQEAVTWLCNTYLAPKGRKAKPKQATASTEKPSPASSGGPPAYLLDAAKRYADAKMEPVSEGGRNSAAFRHSGHLRSFVTETGERLRTQDVYNFLMAWNVKNESQLDSGELWGVAQNGETNGTPPEDKVVKAPPSKLQNYETIEGVDEKGNEVRQIVPLPIAEIARNCRRIYSDWPKVACGQLFREDGGKVTHMIKTDQLFGWLKSERTVSWKGNSELAARGEFFEALPDYCDQFDAVEESPHFPAMPKHYYACQQPLPGDGAALSKLVDFFSPASEHDRQMIYAFVATIFWGGPPGQRPAFLVTSEAGTGAGKTTLVEQIARLAGGSIDVSVDAKEEKLRQDLMTPSERTKRVVLLDNIKSSRLSVAAIEALITGREVSGHGMYVGYGKRPNTLTWCLTANGASLGRDMAQRSVEIRLAAHKNSNNWLANLDAYITNQRQAIINDVAAFFARQPAELTVYDRRGSWEWDVIGRLPTPDLIAAEIKRRQPESDVDAEEASLIREYVQGQLELCGLTAKECGFIRSATMADWVGRALGETLSTTASTKKLNALHAAGSLPEATRPKRNGSARGTLWVPAGVTTTDVVVDVDDRLNNRFKRGTA